MRQRRSWATLIGLIGFALATGTAGAEKVCDDRQKIARSLATEFGEVRESAGPVANGRTIEIFTSSETGSWTVLITHPGGLACVVATGEAQEAVLVGSGEHESLSRPETFPAL